MKYYIDCEFDGHNGPLLSMAVIREDGESIHIQTSAKPLDPWVGENVMPHMDSHKANASFMDSQSVGDDVKLLLGGDSDPVIIADSPVDIARFCQAITTARDGGYSPNLWRRITFEVHDINCYPTTLAGAVQHNAWWDAMALRHLLQEPTA